MSDGRRRDNPTWEFFSEIQDQFYGKIKQNVLRARKATKLAFIMRMLQSDENCH